MSNPNESALVADSLNGDWQARAQLYRKFVRENSRLSRLGGSYADRDDFLHDCFTNVLRTGHDFRGDGKLSDWVASVAAWTALEHERLKDTSHAGAKGFVRICAAIEADDPEFRARPALYVPPRSGPEDTLVSRISDAVGEPQASLLRLRAMEDNSWEAVAAAAGKSLSATGPILVRAVDRLSRFFSAPPPLNEDLEPVFSEVAAAEASARKADPFKPRGRVISMQLDPAFYSVSPETRAIGLTVPAEVRTIRLWDAARASAAPDEMLRNHLAKCRYCSDVLRSLLLMQQALLSGPQVDFRSCPGAYTLLKDASEASERFTRHVAECEVCKAERTLALGGAQGVIAADSRPAAKPGTRIGWAVAAAVLLGGVFIGGLRYFTPETKTAAAAPVVTAPAAPEIVANSKYIGLVQRIPSDDQKLMASVLPKDQLMVMEALQDFKSGNRVRAKEIALKVANEFSDPGAQMLYAECLYSEQASSEAYREMQKAEAMPPRNAFRCWALLQSALMIGDRATAEREVEHLSSDPEFGARAKAILAQMRAIK